MALCVLPEPWAITYPHRRSLPRQHRSPSLALSTFESQRPKLPTSGIFHNESLCRFLMSLSNGATSHHFKFIDVDEFAPLAKPVCYVARFSLLARASSYFPDVRHILHGCLNGPGPPPIQNGQRCPVSNVSSTRHFIRAVRAVLSNYALTPPLPTTR